MKARESDARCMGEKTKTRQFDIQSKLDTKRDSLLNREQEIKDKMKPEKSKCEVRKGIRLGAENKNKNDAVFEFVKERLNFDGFRLEICPNYKTQRRRILVNYDTNVAFDSVIG